MKAIDNKHKDLFGFKKKSNRRFMSVKSIQKSICGFYFSHKVKKSQNVRRKF